MRRMPECIKKHYHWLIATVVFLEMAIYGGLLNSASIFVHPISQGLGISTTSYSLATMPYTVICFLGTCLSGALFNRFGYQRSALVSLVLVAGSLVLTAVSQNIVVFCISKILFGMGYAACFTAGSVRIVKDWFRKRQGFVLGAVNMSTGLGGSALTLFLTGIINTKGWRAANLAAAAVVAVIAVLYLLLKDKPEQMGRRAYGFEEPEVNPKKLRREAAQWEGYPLKEQFKRPAFYLMCVCVLLSCVSLYTTTGFIIPHYRSLGFSADQAALYQSVCMLSLAVFKLLGGYLYDEFGALPVTVGCMICAIAGQWLQATVTDPVLNYGVVVILSVGFCMTSIMVPLITMDVFGHGASLGVNGIFLGLSSMATLFANPISSMCYDIYGVYTPVYRIASLVNIVILALYLILFYLGRRDRQEALKQQKG